MITVTATLKSWSGSYNTREWEFETQEDYDSWVESHTKNHRKGKIIGIIQEIHT